MIKIEQQIAYIEEELAKYRIAYKISLKRVNEGDKAAVLVLALIENVIANLRDVKVSLKTLKNINNE